jgi:acyl-coenzyme A synthetase/AMP-(fatty) acid ligase
VRPWNRRLSDDARSVLLASHPRVADVAVIPRPNERTGQVPIAAVVPRGTLSPDELIAWVAERVAPHKRIRAVRLASQIPRTPSGKILRRVLIEEDQARDTRRGHQGGCDG